MFCGYGLPQPQPPLPPSCFTTILVKAKTTNVIITHAVITQDYECNHNPHKINVLLSTKFTLVVFAEVGTEVHQSVVRSPSWRLGDSPIWSRGDLSGLWGRHPPNCRRRRGGHHPSRQWWRRRGSRHPPSWRRR